MLNPVQLEAVCRAKFGFVKRSMGSNGLEIITRCPRCGRRKLSINAVTGIYRCFHGCHGGHVERLLEDVKLGLLSMPTPIQARPVDASMPGTLVPLTELANDHHAVEYVRRRRLDPVYLENNYQIRYCSEGRSYARGLFNTSNTLVIPVYMGGKLMGWQSRLLYDPDKVPESDCAAMGFIQDPDGGYLRPPKYMTMPGMSKGSILWNYDLAVNSEIVAVCEGVFDALAIGRCAVATFGKGVSDTQCGQLATMNRKLILGMLDPDAEKENISLCASLSARGVPSLPVNLKGYHDAGEAPQLEIWKQIDSTMKSNGLKLEDYKLFV